MANEPSKLVDQWGAVIPQDDIDRLKSQEAAPSSFSARPPFVGNVGFDMDPRRLGAIIRAADNGNTRDWFILAEEIEELFPHYLAVLSKRKRQVALLPMTIEPAEGVKDAEKHADFVRRWLDRETLKHALFDAFDGLGKGYSINELIWESWNGGFVPTEIIWRNQRDFEVSWEDGHTLWLRNDAGFEQLHAHKYMVHRHTLKSGSPVRSSLTRAVAWLWMYSTYTGKDWQLFIQGYGLPVRLGKYGPGASDGDKRTLMRAVRGIAGNLAAIIPTSMQIEFVEANGATEGAKLYSDRANWLDQQVSKLVLGGTASTDATAGGHAAGRDHRAGEQDVEKFDAGLMSNSVNRQIIPAIISFSFGPQPGYPKARLGQDEMAPISDVIAAAADLGPLGFKVKSQNLYDRLQLDKPEPGDDVIGMPAAGTNPDGSPIVSADVKIKANPHPEINPDSDARALMSAGLTTKQYRAARVARQGLQGGVLGRLERHTAAAPEQIMDALEERLSREAGAAIAQMTALVRGCMEEADENGEGMEGFAKRLSRLKLNPHDFAVAMSQGMALAHLAGQANVLDELR